MFARFLHDNLKLGKRRDAALIATLAVAVFVAFLAYIARLSDVTHDAFHEMALIKVYFESGHFPLGDVFAFTPTVYPAVHHEWGTGLVLYWIADASPLGLHGMAVLRVILVLAIALTLYRVARNGGAHPILICLCAPLLFPLLWVGFATLRAQLFTLLFLLLQMLMQQSDWRGERRWILFWALLYVVWLNMHAGFVVGVAMMFMHVVERWATEWFNPIDQRNDGIWERWFTAYQKLWHHFLLIPILTIGILINPWGTQYGPYLLRAIWMPRPTMLEWQPLWMTHDSMTAMTAFGLSLLALGYVAKNRRWMRLRGWLFCCLAAYMALKHLRHGSLYAIVWMAYMPGWLTPTAFGRSVIALFQERRLAVMRSATAMAMACGLFVLWHPIWLASLPTTDPNSLMVYPSRVVDYLRQRGFQGNLMTPFAAGAYVSWRFYPDVRISIDGRYEVAYQEDVLPKHNQFYLAKPGWQEILAEYPVDMVLVQANCPVLQQLGKSGTGTEAWRPIYRDDVFTLFAKDDIGIPSSTLPTSER